MQLSENASNHFPKVLVLEAYDFPGQLIFGWGERGGGWGGMRGWGGRVPGRLIALLLADNAAERSVVCVMP